MDFIANDFKSLNIGAMTSASDDASLSENIIDLSLGDHDINTDKRVMESACNNKYIKHTMYTHPLGDELFRNEIIDFCKNKYKNTLNKNQIMATVGAGHGLYLALKSIINKNDEIILIAPYYPAYIDQINLVKAKLVEVNTKQEDGYIPSIEDIELKINKNTKAIIINSPCNPTGSIYPKTLLEEIYKLSRKYNFMILSDEIYTTFVYGKNKFVSMLEVDKKLTNTAIFRSMSKDYAMTGWRIGFIIADKKLINVCRVINDAITYSAPTIGQNGSIEAVKLSDEIGSNLNDIYRKRVNYVYNRLSNIEKLRVIKPQGGIYLFVDVTKTNLDGNKLTKILVENKVLVLPGEIFGTEYKNYIRITCNKNLEILKSAMDIVEQVCT